MGRSGFTSMSLGPRGMKMNVGKRRLRSTVGIPGTGLSYTTSTSSGARTTRKHATAVQVPVEIAVPLKPPNSHKLLKTLGTLVMAFIVGAATHWLLGLLVASVLLVMIFRSRDPHPAPAGAEVLLPTVGADAEVEPQPAAPATATTISDGTWERLLLTTSAKLCSGPDGRSERLGLLDAQAEVTVLDRRPDWMFVQSDSGVEGWARDQNWVPVARSNS